jgi:hypothetical protein
MYTKNIFKFLTAFLLLLMVSAGAASATAYEVATVGELQTAVGSAVSGDTVHLADGTYTLTSTVDITTSGLTIYGDGYDQCMVTTNQKSYFASSSEPAFFWCYGVDDIMIYGIKFRGPASSALDIMDSSEPYFGGADEYHNAIKFNGYCTNCTVHDCYFTLLLSDGIRTSSSENNVYYNNIFDTTGHDGIQTFYDMDGEVYNNYFAVICNNGIRLSNADGFSIHDNTFTNGLTNSGWCSVQLQADADDNTFERNVFTETTDNYPYAGYSHTGTGNYMANSIFYDTPSTKFYNVNGYTTSNNTEYEIEHDWASWGYGFDESLLMINQEEIPEEVEVGIPTLISPTDLATVELDEFNSTTFNWSGVENATEYRLEISRYTDFSSLTRDRNTTNTSYYVGVDQNATYYWRVSAYAGEWGDPSTYQTFYTIAEEPEEEPEEPEGLSVALTIEDGALVIRITGFNSTELISLDAIF